MPHPPTADPTASARRDSGPALSASLPTRRGVPPSIRPRADADVIAVTRVPPASGTAVDGRPAGESDRLLTADQLAVRWQVPKSQVYRLTRDGRIPTVRLGRYYRYRLAAVEAWERESEALAAAAA